MEQILFSGIKLDDLLERIEHLIDTKLSINPTEAKQSNYLSRKDVATLLRITLPTLHEWTKIGYLKAYKMGTRVLYKESEVKAALETVPSFKGKKGGLMNEKA